MEKFSKKSLINIGKGLQDVDGIKTSDYYNEQSEKYINNEISFDDLKSLITSYYKNKRDDGKRTKEADNVSNRIAEILNDDSFSFSKVYLRSIHKYLFDGLLDNAGNYREYNISKKEWVLDDDSVSYGDFRDLDMLIDYDLAQEKSFIYQGLSETKIIKHLASFLSNLWQIHAFGEGNTRTIAVFFIKYMRTLGYDLNNDTFSNNAWYFRNALVRANYSNLPKGIYSDDSFLIKFLRNLLLGETNELNNKELHVSYKKIEESKEEKLISLLKENNKITTLEMSDRLDISIRTVNNILSSLKEKKLVKRINGRKNGYWKIKESIIKETKDNK